MIRRTRASTRPEPSSEPVSQAEKILGRCYPRAIPRHVEWCAELGRRPVWRGACFVPAQV